jgi:hypothetical protein
MSENLPGFVFMVLLMTSVAYLGTWPHTLRQHFIYVAVLAAMVLALVMWGWWWMVVALIVVEATIIILFYWAEQRRRTPF